MLPPLAKPSSSFVALTMWNSNQLPYSLQIHILLWTIRHHISTTLIHQIWGTHPRVFMESDVVSRFHRPNSSPGARNTIGPWELWWHTGIGVTHTHINDTITLWNPPLDHLGHPIYPRMDRWPTIAIQLKTMPVWTCRRAETTAIVRSKGDAPYKIFCHLQPLLHPICITDAENKGRKHHMLYT